MKRGRKPKPSAVRVLEGNPGHRPINASEPVCTGKAVRPKWLVGEGKKFWDNYAGEAEAMGILTAVDGPLFAAMAEHWGEYVRACRATKRTGFKAHNKHDQISPLLTWKKQALATYLVLATEFGFTPSARCRLSLPVRSEEDDKDKEFLGANN